MVALINLPDEDAVMKDAGAMAAARRRLQEVHDAKAALYSEETKVVCTLRYDC